MTRCFESCGRAGIDLADDALRDALAPAVGHLTLESTPSGAEASVARVGDSGAEDAPLTFQPIGRTPLRDVPLVAGEYVIRLQRQGLAPGESLLHVKPRQASGVVGALPEAGTPQGFAFVPAGRVLVAPVEQVDAFAIGRHEVTNEEFLRFVEAGGYRTEQFWPATMEIDGQTLPRVVVAAKFVDRTGVPGPRSWASGIYPDGKGNHPVVGVTWYEAAAYARFVEMELPAWPQWWRAALADRNTAFPWGDDVSSADIRANFGLIGTAPVGKQPRGMSPFGCYDMAGNVREWLRDVVPGTSRRRVVGGSWQDASYMFEASHAELFEPSFANESIGFRLVRRSAAGR